MAENGPPASSFVNSDAAKLGSFKKRCGGFHKWAVRYLILDRSQRLLYYYQGMNDKAPRRVLDLTQCAVVPCEPKESDNQPGLRITVPNERDYIFVASNQAVVDDWLQTIYELFIPAQQQQQMAPQGYGGGGNRMSAAGGPPRDPNLKEENSFSYNGPTIAVIPGRGIQNMAPPPENPPPLPPMNLPAGMNMPQQQAVPMGTPQRGGGGPGRTQTDATLTLQAGGKDDTNNTLVNGVGGAGRMQPAGPIIVPLLTLAPDNTAFPTIEKPIRSIVKVGRYTGSHDTAGEERFTYKSKVISRDHAEFWSVNNDVYLRDTRSQSGTFLNAMRLSEPGKESKPYKLKAGDVVQFGVDYKGSKEESAKSITVRVDIRMVQIDPNPGHEGEGNGGQAGGRTLVAGESTETNKARATLTDPAEVTAVNEVDQQGMRNVMPPPPLPYGGQPGYAIHPGMAPMNMPQGTIPRMMPGGPMPMMAQGGTMPLPGGFAGPQMMPMQPPGAYRPPQPQMMGGPPQMMTGPPQMMGGPPQMMGMPPQNMPQMRPPGPPGAMNMRPPY